MIEIEQGTGKYVTIAADEETALRWSGDIGFKMMQYNQIRGVLPISQQYIDERLHVYYEVNKMQTLESVYAEAGLSVDKALKILLSLLQTVQGAEQYFLSAEQFVLNEQMGFLVGTTAEYGSVTIRIMMWRSQRECEPSWNF